MKLKVDNVEFDLEFVLNETSKQYKMIMVMMMELDAKMYPNAIGESLFLIKVEKDNQFKILFSSKHHPEVGLRRGSAQGNVLSLQQAAGAERHPVYW